MVNPVALLHCIIIIAIIVELPRPAATPGKNPSIDPAKKPDLLLPPWIGSTKFTATRGGENNGLRQGKTLPNVTKWYKNLTQCQVPHRKWQKCRECIKASKANMMKSLDLPCRISEDFGNISDISHPSALIMGASQHLSQTRHVHFGVSQSLVGKAATAPSIPAPGTPWNPMPSWSSHIKPKLGHLEAKQCGPYRTDAGVCEIPGQSTGRHIWHMMLSSFLHHGLCLWCGEWWSDVTWRWVKKKVWRQSK